jgi:glycosyltransferase involved in cell wall biosynthesis
MGTIESPKDGGSRPAGGRAGGAAAADRRSGDRGGAEPVAVIVAARDEAERIEATLGALAEAFPAAALWVADDGSRDGTAALAREAGAQVLSTGSPRGKGGAMTEAGQRALASAPGAGGDVFVLCDGDLGASAAGLGPLVTAIADGRCDLAVAAFAQRVGGGFGVALGFARWAIRRACGLQTLAPISGQRALDRATLEQVLPFADGFGLEVGMTIDAVQSGRRVMEIELDLSHRATGRSLRGFAHRGRQLLDFARAYVRRR